MSNNREMDKVLYTQNIIFCVCICVHVCVETRGSCYKSFSITHILRFEMGYIIEPRAYLFE